MKNFLFVGLGPYNISLSLSKWRNIKYQHILEYSMNGWDIWATDPRYYNKDRLNDIENSNWIDHYLQRDICDDWPDIPLFDAWDCTSVIEHVKKDKAEDFIKGLQCKVKIDSVGYIHGDLSDHGLNHSTDRYYDHKDKAYEVYLNRISEEEWLSIIDKYFTYSRIYRSDEERFSLYDVKVKV